MSSPGLKLEPNPQRLQVLLAEGDKVSLTHLDTLLTKVGYQVVTAQDGLEARHLLDTEDPPRLAVLDWSMPGINGIDLCRELHQSKRHRDTYVILLTRWNESNDRIAALEAGADDCVPRPVDVRELRLRLQHGAQTILERALRESEERFRSAFECAGIGMALVKVTGKFLQVNRALCDFLGYSREELLGMDLHSVTNPAEVPACSALLEHFFDQRQRSGEFERQLITKAGDIVLASFTLSSVLDADENPTSFVIQVQDITKRKKTEEQLRRNESFLRAITDNVDDLIFVANKENKWLYASPSHARNLGYEPRELEGTEVLRLVHPDDRELVEQTSIEVIETGLPKTVEFRMQHKSGAWRNLEGHGGVLRNNSGDVEGIVVVARLIDERIQAEQKLQAAHAETELFLQAIPSILIGLDSDGRIVRVNHIAAAALRVHGQKVRGHPLDDCGIKWLHPDMKAEVQRWLAAESTYRCDNLGFEIEGERRFLGLNVRRMPPLNQEEKPGIIITGADITKRKELEEQLRQAQKLEAIGQLSAGVAHEINTPTQYVSDNVRFLKDSWGNIADLLRLGQQLRQAGESSALNQEDCARFDQLAKDADIEYMLQEIPNAIEQSREGLERVAKIVHAIKEFSHPGSEEKKGVDLNKAIETTVTVARNEWKYVADMQLNLDETLPMVPCLAGEFNQVILNLIVNAAHAITDSVGKNSQQKGQITITTRQIETWAEIEIRDTGKGIPEKIRSRVFEPFFTTKAVGQGTGQGLALAHSVIVNRHQGQIWFDSTLGAGTTFYVRLPLAPAKP